MRFLVDRCAGHRIAVWLREQGHDVKESRDLGPDPGDRAILVLAAEESRTLVTIDSDFGTLVHRDQVAHCGIVRLPDVPVARRIRLMQQVLDQHAEPLEHGAVITVQRNLIRISLARQKGGGGGPAPGSSGGIGRPA